MIIWILSGLIPIGPFLGPSTEVLGPAPLVQEDFSRKLKEIRFAAKNERDEEAIAMLDQLLVAIRDSEEKPDEKKAVRELSWVFILKRDDDDNTLFAAVAASLGEFGKEGEKAILKTLKKKEIRERPLVVAMLLSSLGSFKEPENVEVLVRYLQDDSADVVRAASESLRRYRLADGEVRKEAVEGLIEGYEEAVQRRSDAEKEEDIDAAEIYLNDVETGYLAALTELTGETHETHASWRSWFEAHKDESWKHAEPAKGGPSLLDRVGEKKKDGSGDSNP